MNGIPEFGLKETYVDLTLHECGHRKVTFACIQDPA